MADLVRIWSFEHDAWWRSDCQGYTTREDEAALCSRAQADLIVYGSTCRSGHGVACKLGSYDGF
jgi:hypothetical protein